MRAKVGARNWYKIYRRLRMYVEILPWTIRTLRKQRELLENKEILFIYLWWWKVVVEVWVLLNEGMNRWILFTKVVESLTTFIDAVIELIVENVRWKLVWKGFLILFSSIHECNKSNELLKLISNVRIVLYSFFDIVGNGWK